MKVLIFDNYDSFTYNLVQMVEEILNEKVEVVKNDKITLEEVEKYDKIILSPGPGIPSEAGMLLPLIKKYAATKPILGVCLGHQAMAEAFGGKLLQLDKVHHGVASEIDAVHDAVLYKNIELPLQVGRYHSWVVDEEDFPDDLTITSRDKNGIIMSLKHKTYPMVGVQFHPESILTPQGKTLIYNFLND